jgi:hypothetical protein
MGKIPVGETASGAYNFAFKRILSVVGVFWLPYLIYGAILAGSIYLLMPELPHQIMYGPWDFSLLMSIGRVSGISSLVGIIAGAMVTVGLQRRAQDLDHGPAFFYFSLGSAVWRMIGAYFLVIVLAIVMAAATAGLCAAAWFGARYIGQPVGTNLVRAIAVLIAICWYIYFLVRLTFFLPAVVVAEEGIGLGRSWTLGGGNFWRIVGVWVVTLLPVAIGFGMVEQAIIGPFMLAPHFNDFIMHHPPDTHEFINRLMQLFRTLGPVLVILVVIRQIVFSGLINGASAAAYRHVVPSGAPPA